MVITPAGERGRGDDATPPRPDLDAERVRWGWVRIVDDLDVADIVTTPAPFTDAAVVVNSMRASPSSEYFASSCTAVAPKVDADLANLVCDKAKGPLRPSRAGNPGRSP